MNVVDFNLNLSLLQLSLSLGWPCCHKRREAQLPVQVPVPLPVRVPGPVSSDRPSGSTCANALPQTVCQLCREVEVYITEKGKGIRYHSVQGCSHAMVAITPCEARARLLEMQAMPSRHDQLLKSADIFSPVCKRHMEAYSTALTE